jgi:hypothetical protein
MDGTRDLLMERLRWAVDLERQLQRGTVAHAYAAGHVAGVAEIVGLALDEDPVALIRDARRAIARQRSA